MAKFNQFIEARKRMGLSQVEMAGRLGVSFATYNRWENGHFKPLPNNRRIFESVCKKWRRKTVWNYGETIHAG